MAVRAAAWWPGMMHLASPAADLADERVIALAFLDLVTAPHELELQVVHELGVYRIPPSALVELRPPGCGAVAA